MDNDKELIHEIAALINQAIEDELDVRHGNMALIPVAEKVAEKMRARIHNQAIDAVRKVLDARFSDIQVDLEILEKR